MAKSKIGVLRVLLLLNNEDFTKKMMSASKEVAAFEKHLTSKLKTLDRVGKSLSRVGSTLTKSFTLPVIGAIGSMALFAQKAAASAEMVEEFSIRSGLAIKTVQQFRYVLDQVGGSFESVQKASIKLQGALYDSTKGSNEQTKALDKLGVKSRNEDLSLRSISSVLPEVFSKLAAVTNETERTALASALFGDRMVADLIPVLSMGAGELDNMMRKATELGLVLSDDQIKAGAKFKDLWDQITAQLKAVALRIGTSLIPLLKSTLVPLIEGMVIPALTKFADWIQKVGDWFGKLSPFVRGIITVFGALLVSIGPLIFVGGQLISWVATLGKLLVPLIGTVKMFGVAIAATSAPVLILVAAIAVLAAVIVVVANNYESFNKFFTDLWAGLKAKVVGDVQTIAFAIGLLVKVMGVSDNLGNGLIGFGAALTKTRKELDATFNATPLASFAGMTDKLLADMGSMWDGLKEKIGGAFSAFETKPDVAAALAVPPSVPESYRTWSAVSIESMALVKEQTMITAEESITAFQQMLDSVLAFTDGIANAVVYGGAKIQEFGMIVMDQAKIFVRAKIFEAVSAYVASALTVVPFPFGLIAAGIAAGGVTALFNTLVPFAEGGVAMRPMAAMVGEAGPEIVMPLDKFERSFKPPADNKMLNEIRELRRELHRKNLTSTVTTVIDGEPLVRRNLRSAERTLRMGEKG